MVTGNLDIYDTEPKALMSRGRLVTMAYYSSLVGGQQSSRACWVT